ncbi:MAG: EAL domain-containing protein [Betaproteobacteria bacterium]|nr:EAL domain-containing protein [Betaproteobacteria bacterium]
MVNSTAILNARILIVDDLKAHIGLLTKTLASAGHTSVTSTTNPFEVCELHRKHRYDLILLDLLMPGMDGFEVMEGLKKIEPDGNIPVIVITAYLKHKLRALQAGAKDFLSTPIDLAEVLVRVHNMLEVRLLHKKLNNYSDLLEQRVRDRTAELEAMHRDLRNSELRYREVFENTSDCLFLLDVTKDMRFKLAELNPAEERSTGYSTSEVSGKFVEETLPEESARLVIANYRRCVEAGTMISYEEELDLPSGLRSFSTTLIPVRDLSGRIHRIIGIAHDITERMRAGEALRESQARLDLALRSASMGVWSFDLIANKRHYDDQTCHLLGIDPAIFAGTAEELFRAMHSDDREAVRRKLAQAIEQNVPYDVEYRAVWPDGSIHHIASRGRLVRDDQGRPLKFNGVVFDITEWKEAQDKIHSLAFYDPLTGLPNRRLLSDRLQKALASCARNGLVGAILFIDLDNFKTINDTLGHALGDSLLQQVAGRLTSTLREEDTVARIGGDEFVIMLEYLNEDEPVAANQAESIGEKILATLSQPYQVASHECRSTCSIGITLFNDRQQSTDELLKQADIAMYQAKKAGRNTLRFFDPQMQDAVTARAAIENELRKALENQRFRLYYQIQVDSFLQPVGAEALIRWNHPDRGLVFPAQFITLAEETGLILPIGQWVLETACAQLKTWQQEEHTRGLVLAVNVSARQFRQVDFVSQVQATVQRHAINPRLLKLELTESTLLENVEDTIATMNALKEIGVRFTLDDFGTGYSSLQYLKRLPLHQIKIDQSFVRDLAADSGDRAIVRTIITMAKSMNLEVIAEGVETEEQLQLLLNMGCTHYQGYLFGKPVPVDQFEVLVKQV